MKTSVVLVLSSLIVNTYYINLLTGFDYSLSHFTKPVQFEKFINEEAVIYLSLFNL